MPFVDLASQSNVTNTPSDPVVNNLPVDNLKSKDPISIEDGLIQNAYSTPVENGEDRVIEQKLDDGTKVISKPFHNNESGMPVVESSTAYPTLETVEQPKSEIPQSSESSLPGDNLNDQTQGLANLSSTTNDVVAAVNPDLEIQTKPIQQQSVDQVAKPIQEEIQSEPQVSQMQTEAMSVKETPQVSQELNNPVQEQIQNPVTDLSNAENIPSIENVSKNVSSLPELESNIQPAIEETVSVDNNVLNPSNATLQEYINYAMLKDASDIHFAVNYPVSLRLDGRLEKIGQEKLKLEDAQRLLLPILTEEQKKELLEGLMEADFMFVDESKNRFRVNVFIEKSNISAAFRWIPKTVRTVDELGLPSILKDFSKIPYGLVLVTGPTGSGKTTTIAAMIEEINRTEPRHIITIEDPVEYVYEPGVALIAQRSMHQDTSGWNVALRAVLRQDPDVVLIGEMRDHETISSALTIAETGHLVFATLHTNTAAQSIDRIIDVFPEGQQNQVRSQLSMMLSGVVSQRLIPLQKGGRKAAMEILIGTPAVKNAIREGKTHQIDNIIQTSADSGMVSLEKSLVELIRKGDIDVNTAKDFTSKPDEIDLLLR